MYGGFGSDNIGGDAGSDTLYGESGDDSLNGDAGQDIIYGGNGNDTIYGGTGTNPSTEADTLYGDNGDDVIKGQLGNDTIYGGSGADTQYGDEGADVIYGGGNEDIFMFMAASVFSDVDIIKDFVRVNGLGDPVDVLNISDAIAQSWTTSSAITDFLLMTTSGSDTLTSIDRDGTGTTYGWTQVATLEGVTGIEDELALLNGGNITG